MTKSKYKVSTTKRYRVSTTKRRLVRYIHLIIERILAPREYDRGWLQSRRYLDFEESLSQLDEPLLSALVEALYPQAATPQHMEAEILFRDPADVEPATAELVDAGFTVERLDWIDDESPTVWVVAGIDTKINEARFFGWVADIVEPIGGWAVEAGPGHIDRDKCNKTCGEITAEINRRN
jgi:hypothetical protein